MVSTAMKTREDEKVSQAADDMKETLKLLVQAELSSMNERIVKLEGNNKYNNNNGIHSGEGVPGIHIGGIDDEVVLLSLKEEEELVDSIVAEEEEEEVWTKVVSSRRSSRNLKIEEKMMDNTMENNTYAALADDDEYVNMKGGENCSRARN